MGKRLAEVTKELAGCKLNGSAIVYESDEEVTEGHVVGGPEDGAVKADNMPNNINFDTEDGVDGDKAQEHARSVKVEFAPNNIKFWFTELEAEMTMASVKSQWLKKTVLQRNLPTKQKEDVMDLLTLEKTEAGDDIYLRLKAELLRIYAQKPCDTYRKALTRQMVGLPSQLGYQIVNDVCKKSSKLSGCCCEAAVLALWEMKLPLNIRAHISNMTFSKDT